LYVFACVKCKDERMSIKKKEGMFLGRKILAWRPHMRLTPVLTYALLFLIRLASKRRSKRPSRLPVPSSTLLLLLLLLPAAAAGMT
jgi:hypothetical protein